MNESDSRPHDPHVSTRDDRYVLRWTVYFLLIVLSAATMASRLMTVESKLGQTPLLSANDRSRWAMVRSLVDYGTFAIDDVILPNGRKRDREWYTIDMVRHRGSDGREHYYSSKPPLLATLIAGQYWLLQRVTGIDLATRPFDVVRLLLACNQIVPLALSWLVLAVLVERHGRTDFGRLFTLACAAFGTFLTTFAVTLNNHLPAAISVLLATYGVLEAWRRDVPRRRDFALAGLCGAFAVANELPALSFCALAGGLLALRSLSRTMAAFVPAAGVVALAFFATNYAAHGTWRPPYAHRRDGAVLATAQVPPAELARNVVPAAIVESLRTAGIALGSEATLEPAGESRWVLKNPATADRFAVRSAGDEVQIRAWDNWYEYDGSYWTSGKKQGVDLGEPSRLRYGVHVLIGHHGVFSLTPIWLLTVVGVIVWLRSGTRLERGLAGSIALLSVVCLTFYVLRPLEDRNYGGVACGFRWVFWLAPLWLLGLLPAADALSRRRSGPWLALALLAVSVFSVQYCARNPWSHPWLYQVFALQ